MPPAGPAWCTWSAGCGCATPPEVRLAEASVADLKPIHTAANVDGAQARFEEFASRWEPKYPAIIKLWRQAWEQFIPFLAFPGDPQGDLHDELYREPERPLSPCHPPARSTSNEQAALKVLYLAVQEREKNRPNPTGIVSGWKQVLNALVLHYGDRIALYR